jgi:hypothetical protein
VFVDNVMVSDGDSPDVEVVDWPDGVAGVISVDSVVMVAASFSLGALAFCPQLLIDNRSNINTMTDVMGDDMLFVVVSRLTC